MDENKIKTECRNGAVLLDVRTAEEYASGHIPGAQNIPLQILEDKVPTMFPDKAQRILTYCQAGVRSEQAVKILRKIGYQNVENIGGIADWTGIME